MIERIKNEKEGREKETVPTLMKKGERADKDGMRENEG